MVRTNLINTGKVAEEMVAMTAHAYEQAKVLTITKVDPPMRLAGGRPIMLANPFLDFVGTWNQEGGRAIFLEVKSTKEHRLPIARDGGLTLSQVQSMARWRNAGAAVGLLWFHASRWAFVSYGQINMVLKEQRKSIEFEMQDCICEQGTGRIVVHFEPWLRFFNVAGTENPLEDTPQK